MVNASEIESQLTLVLLRYRAYERALMRGDNEHAKLCLDKAQESRNVLYDMLGMDDYKFSLDKEVKK